MDCESLTVCLECDEDKGYVLNEETNECDEKDKEEEANKAFSKKEGKPKFYRQPSRTDLLAIHE